MRFSISTTLIIKALVRHMRLPKIAEQQVAEDGYNHNAKDNRSPTPPITSELFGGYSKLETENYHRAKLSYF